jgi:hypothetical protein
MVLHPGSVQGGRLAIVVDRLVKGGPACCRILTTGVFPCGRNLSDCLNEAEVLTWQAERSLEDYLGLSTKADSVILFQDLTVQAPGRLVCLLG